jgi:hypothetical protein
VRAQLPGAAARMASVGGCFFVQKSC